MKRRFIVGLMVGSIAGFVAGVSVAFSGLERLHAMRRPMERLAAAADASSHTYQIYLYAPYSVAEEYLDKHASLLASLAEESSEESERGTYLRDLAVNQARLAKLSVAHGETEKATILLKEAMSHLRDSGSSWTREDLQRFVDRLDERNLGKPPPQNDGGPADGETDA